MDDARSCTQSVVPALTLQALGRSRHLVRCRLRGLCHAVCALSVSTALARRASAHDAFALSWGSGTRPHACVTQAALREAVQRKLGWDPFSEPEHAEVFIEGEETVARPGDFRGHVVSRDRRGELLGARDLAARSCADFLSAATLVVALIIDPEGGEGAALDSTEEPPLETRSMLPPPAPPERPPSEAPPSPAAHRPATPHGTPRAPSARRHAPAFELDLGGGIGTGVGVLPSPSTTLFAFARLPSRSRWSFDWRGAYSLPQSLRRPDVDGTFAAVEQTFRACFAFVRWRGGSLDGCIGIAWGAVLPRTAGVRQGNDSWRVIAGPTAGAALAFGRKRASIRLDVGVTLPSRVYSFSYLDAADVRRPLYSTQDVIFSVSLSTLATISQ